jgi:hypothetical protein
MKGIAVLANVSALVVATSALAEDKLRLIVRAFIPNAHPTNAGYVKPVPGQPGKFMIPDPVPGSTKCYSTDNRGFSATADAPARITTDIQLVAKSSPAVAAGTGNAMHRPGTTTEYDCASGKTLRSASGSVAGCHVGAPAHADGKVQVVFGCSAKNPLAPPIISPAIDYSGTITYDLAKKTISYVGDIGTFPSYEGYVSLNGGPMVKLFSMPPSGGNVWWLYDGGLGVNSRRVETKNLALSK